MITCKLRCVTFESHVSDYVDPAVPSTSVLFRPIMGKGHDEENKNYWRSTPTGNARLRQGYQGITFELGKSYYFDKIVLTGDMEPPDPTWSVWTLGSANPRAYAGADIVLHPKGNESGEISLGIDNPYGAMPFVLADRELWEQTARKCVEVGEWNTWDTRPRVKVALRVRES